MGSVTPDEEEKRLDEEIKAGENAVEEAREEAEVLKRREEFLVEREKTLVNVTPKADSRTAEDGGEFCPGNCGRPILNRKKIICRPNYSNEERQSLSAAEEELKTGGNKTAGQPE